MPRYKTPLIISIVAGSQLSQAVASTSGTPALLQWIDKHLFKRIQIAGNRNLGYHDHKVIGDREAYESTTYYGLGGRRFTDVGQMTLSGKSVLGVFNFDMSLSDNRFQDPQSQRFSINYAKGPFGVDLGDIQGSLLSGNRFATFNKRLYGAAAHYQGGRLQAKLVHSESKGSARTVPMQGNNSAGPYYLRASQIIVDSEEIRVDDVPMKPGVDYVINYDVGSITFVNRAIAPTSTIVATFEVLGFNSRRGTIQGGGLSYDLGRFGKVGFTAIEQRQAASGGLNTRLEEFEGYGSSASWYTLQFEPLPGRPVLIRLNGVLQAEGVHYVFDPNVPSLFRFLFDVPGTSVVSVTYTPKPTQTVDGDRRVIGFDYTLPLNRDGRSYLHYNQASGELNSSVNPMKGVARGLDAAYVWGPFQLSASVRDVPHTFVGIETKGFHRNEKASEFSLDYTRGGLTASLDHQNSSVSTRRLDGNGNTIFGRSRIVTDRAQASYRPTKGQPWNLEHRRTASSSASQDNRLDTTTLSTSRMVGKVNMRLAVEHQDGFGPIGTSLGATPGNLSLDTMRLGADYSSGDLTLAMKGSLSSVSAGGKSGRGTDVGLSAAYSPSDRLSVEGSYNVSNSGQLAALGSFQNGSGVGYDNNGFNGGAVGAGFNVGSTDYRLLSLVTAYKLTPRIALDVNFNQSRSSGAVSTNNDSTAYGMGLSWNMGSGHLFAMSFDQSKTRFIGTGTQSEATTLNATLVGSPRGPWSYRLGLGMLLSGGSSPYQQDSLLFDAYLGHRIDNRQRLSLVAQSGSVKGYLPQRDMYAALMYEYRLFENVGLIGSYKWRRVMNSDPLVSSGAYRSSGFDIELSFNFGG